MNSEGMGTTGTAAAQAAAGKIHIYQLAKELAVPNTELVKRIQALGIEAKNHMSKLDVDQVARVKRAYDKERQANTVEVRLTDTVMRRRRKDTKDAPAPVQNAAPAAHATPAVSARDERDLEDGEADGDGRPEPRLAATTAGAAVRKDGKRERGGDAIVEPAAEAPKRGMRGEAPSRTVVVTRAGRDDGKGESKAESQGASERTAQPATAAGEATVEARGASEQRPAAEPSDDKVDARAAAVPADAAAETPAIPAEPKKPEPIKFGPTGRVIDLPGLRQPKIEVQVTENPRAARGTRDLTQRRDISGRDKFSRQPQGKKKVVAGKKNKSTTITTPAAHKRIVEMEETIAVAELAKQLSVKATDVLKKLWSLGMTGITLNSAIDQDTCGVVAAEFGFEVKSKAFVEEDVFAQEVDAEGDLEWRAPVVTIMGHVDHGKTSLLDAIRSANVAAGEAGGITQHIGAYKVTTEAGNEVVFLDTPGHEAFTAMRARGAQMTDIVVLVVAADDGVMPQTIEALQHAKNAEVPIIVAVNKIDKPGAQPDRIRQQLAAHGLNPETWGGETIYVDVSARAKTGIDTLLEMIGLQSEVLELQANPNKLARGAVVEAKLDRNRGPVATVLVQDGTLKVGDTVVAGEHLGKVRAMLDDQGRSVTEAGPSTPVEILGLSGVPNAGENFNSVSDEKAAKELVDHRRDSRRKKELSGTSKVTLENILEKIAKGEAKELKIVLKSDVQGSAEAVKDALIGLSTDKVRVDVISSGVGGITESDVNLARAGTAIIVGFHVRPAGKAAQLAEQESVDIKLYDIIYEALDDVKKAMAGLLAPVKREKALGKAEVRQTFTIPKLGTICGSQVTEGLIRRNSQVRLVRDSVLIYTGKISSLRRFKDDAREVGQGYECGIGIEGFNDVKVGDIIEAYEVEEFAATLS